jgi:hypothetical protein
MHEFAGASGTNSPGGTGKSRGPNGIRPAQQASIHAGQEAHMTADREVGATHLRTESALVIYE